MEPGQEGRVQGSLRICCRTGGGKTLKTLRIKGFQGTSLLDYPGRIAALIFTGGCNLTCPYCHNGELVLNSDDYPDIPVDELLADLKLRSKFIDGVVISGGEPTIDVGLPAFLSELKALDLLVKLDTNGLRPDVLQSLLEQQLLDYVAVDIKTAPNRYHELHITNVDSALLCETVSILNQADLLCEYRTTCIPHLVAGEDIRVMGQLLQGAKLWILQQYNPQHALNSNWQRLEAYSQQQLAELTVIAQTYVEQVQLRGL